ncbi:hypothetical protein BDV95DRAFT_605560 [Massariosphaeria phaeospora]|uniref:Uncharacterized protein n=1 Tax=Massariosphaeria phaeospora TaxID=100035 RepID=A0A7C8M9R2_9PLEO|nr:hypothetical protein BDV95DRAFT_605560 [Massariosphaeria phaeospora]
MALTPVLLSIARLTRPAQNSEEGPASPAPAARVCLTAARIVPAEAERTSTSELLFGQHAAGKNRPALLWLRSVENAFRNAQQVLRTREPVVAPADPGIPHISSGGF